jgi:hypothetical protein
MNRFAAIIAVIALGASAPAGATTLARLSHEQVVDASDAIVEGTVSRVWSTTDARGRVWTRAYVRVDRSLKGGEAVGNVVMVEAAGGTAATGEFTSVGLTARYSEGERVLLYLCEKRFGTVYGTVGMLMGKYTIKQNPADGSDMVVRFTVPVTEAYDARFIPNPPVSERVSLASMEAKVAARVKEGWDGEPIPGISHERLLEINNVQPGVK